MIDTVLGTVTLTRARYHCAACGHGLTPRDAGLGVAGASMSPGLRAMNDQAAAAGPFAGSARLEDQGPEAELAAVRRRPLAAARHRRGAKVLAESI